MRFSVTDDADAPHDFYAWLFGLLAVVCSDSLWLFALTKQCGETTTWRNVYKKYFNKIDRGAPEPIVAVVCLVAYALLASTAALTFVAIDAPHAAAAGAVVGVWVFGAFNITMFVMVPPQKRGHNYEDNDDAECDDCLDAYTTYPWSTALCDVLYGTGATALLFYVQHNARLLKT